MLLPIANDAPEQGQLVLPAMLLPIANDAPEQGQLVLRAHEAAFDAIPPPPPVPEGGVKPHIEHRESPWAQGQAAPAAPLP